MIARSIISKLTEESEELTDYDIYDLDRTIAETDKSEFVKLLIGLGILTKKNGRLVYASGMNSAKAKAKLKSKNINTGDEDVNDVVDDEDIEDDSVIGQHKKKSTKQQIKKFLDDHAVAIKIAKDIGASLGAVASALLTVASIGAPGQPGTDLSNASGSLKDSVGYIKTALGSAISDSNNMGSDSFDEIDNNKKSLDAAVAKMDEKKQRSVVLNALYKKAMKDGGALDIRQLTDAAEGKYTMKDLRKSPGGDDYARDAIRHIRSGGKLPKEIIDDETITTALIREGALSRKDVTLARIAANGIQDSLASGIPAGAIVANNKVMQNGRQIGKIVNGAFVRT